MPWSNQQKVEFLLQLPWSFVPSLEDGETVVRVREMPSVVVSGTDPETLERELWDSLRESLATYLHFSDPVPRPEHYTAPFPWEAAWQPLRVPPRVLMRVHTGGQSRIEEERANSDTIGSSLQFA